MANGALFFPKPVTPENLVENVRAAVQRRVKRRVPPDLMAGPPLRQLRHRDGLPSSGRANHLHWPARGNPWRASSPIAHGEPAISLLDRLHRPTVPA